jgi:short-subunit dehydrogenase
VSNKQVWFITGASRGMGVDFAKAAFADIDAERDLSTSLAFD